MPSNRYLDKFIPNFYQRQTIDIMVYTFIDTYRFIQPSVTLYEAASAFLIRYNIDESLYSVSTVVTTYQRTLKDYYDGQKVAKK